MPDIIEQLPDAKEKSINEMTGNYMRYGILTGEKGQWYMFVAGLVLTIAAALAVIAAGSA